jgi:hypothetical protein
MSTFGTSLFSLNEQETLDSLTSIQAQTNSYSTTKSAFNPLNAISVYIKSLEFVKKTIEEIIPLYENISKLARAPKSQNELIVADKKLEVAPRMKRLLDIMIEFQKGFSLSKDNEVYEHLKFYSQGIEFIDERINLTYATSNPSYLKDATSAVDKLINAFNDLQRSMEKSLKDEASNVNEAKA